MSTFMKRFQQYNIRHTYSKFVCEQKAGRELEDLLNGLVKPHQRIVNIQEFNNAGHLSMTVVVENFEIEAYDNKAAFREAELVAKKCFLEDPLLNPNAKPAVKMNLDNVGRRRK